MSSVTDLFADIDPSPASVPFYLALLKTNDQNCFGIQSNASTTRYMTWIKLREDMYMFVLYELDL